MTRAGRAAARRSAERHGAGGTPALRRPRRSRRVGGPVGRAPATHPRGAARGGGGAGPGAGGHPAGVRGRGELRVILLGGSGVISRPGAGGVFFCPGGGGAGASPRREARRWFTVFWVPVLPLRGLGELVEC